MDHLNLFSSQQSQKTVDFWWCFLILNMQVHFATMLPTWHGQEVIHRGDVIHSLSQDAYLLLPLIFENIHIVLSHFALGSRSQSESCIDNLDGEKGTFFFTLNTHTYNLS